MGTWTFLGGLGGCLYTQPFLVHDVPYLRVYDRRRSSAFEFKFFVPKFLSRAVDALAHRDLLLLAARHRYSALRLLKYACLSSPLSGLIGPRRAPLAGPTRVAGPVAACHQLYQPLGPLQPLRPRPRLHLGPRVWHTRGLAICPINLSEAVQGRSSAALRGRERNSFS